MVRRNLGLPHRLISKNFNCVIWDKTVPHPNRYWNDYKAQEWHPDDNHTSLHRMNKPQNYELRSSDEPEAADECDR